jgi:nucleotide-binding universal stress UspA family protein
VSKKAILPLRKILCPTDFSEPSYEALEVAIELASNFSAELCMVHVVPEVPRPSWASTLDPEQAKCGLEVSEYEEMLHIGAQQKLHELIEDRIPKSLCARAIVSDGEAVTQVLRTVAEELPDLIVIATQGQTGLSHLIFGSVTEKLVRLATCPVLTIHGSTASTAESPQT